jgi:hypothetical protein
MSRLYKMSIKVLIPKASASVEVAEAIGEELNDLWDMADLNEYRDKNLDVSISGCEDGFLTGGETEEEFSRRAAEAIWAAAGCYVEVYVSSTCLEDLPSEDYVYDEDEYKPWIKEKE